MKIFWLCWMVRLYVIALVEAKTTNDDVQPHLHFELWHRGTPMNPEKYIVF